MLRLQFVQGRSFGKHKEPMETSHCVQRMRAFGRHCHICLGLLRHQEQQIRFTVQPPQNTISLIPLLFLRASYGELERVLNI